MTSVRCFILPPTTSVRRFSPSNDVRPSIPTNAGPQGRRAATLQPSFIHSEFIIHYCITAALACSHGARAPLVLQEERTRRNHELCFHCSIVLGRSAVLAANHSGFAALLLLVMICSSCCYHGVTWYLQQTQQQQKQGDYIQNKKNDGGVSESDLPPAVQQVWELAMMAYSACAVLLRYCHLT